MKGLLHLRKKGESEENPARRGEKKEKINASLRCVHKGGNHSKEKKRDSQEAFTEKRKEKKEKMNFQLHKKGKKRKIVLLRKEEKVGESIPMKEEGKGGRQRHSYFLWKKER